ncbi:MAG TPA: hypothetical protein VGF86_15920 [Candidatus Tumulicola sp.]
MADEFDSIVDVYAYKNGKTSKLDGTLTGITPVSECVDPLGSVYVTTGTSIYVYPHGAAQPSKVLQDHFGYTSGCAVDPLTGNLAVANAYGPNSSAGNVLIYAKASGKPKLLYIPSVQNPEYCGYDDTGNLFADGYDNDVNLALGELAHGSKHFTAITVSGAKVELPKSLQWSSPYLLVDDSAYHGKSMSAIYQLSLSGSTATVVATIPLRHSYQIEQFWKDGNKIVTAGTDYADVLVYLYPSGKPFGTIPNQEPSANAVVVSNKKAGGITRKRS